MPISPGPSSTICTTSGTSWSARARARRRRGSRRGRSRSPSSGRWGSRVHDEIFYDDVARRFHRRTNRAGGIEGGMTNGEEVRVTGYMKPLSTLPRPLHTVNVVTKEATVAVVERTDTCAILAAGVIGE